MHKFMMSIIALVTSMVAIPAAIHAQSLPSHSGTRIMTPCHITDIDRSVQACVLAYRVVKATGPVMHVPFDNALGTTLKGRVKNYSIIYGYHVSKEDDGTTIEVNFGDQSAMMTASSDKLLMVWSTTHDGGRTWSKLQSNETGALGM